MEQLTIDQAIAQRDEGMARSQQHAERIEPGWQDSAYAMLTRYCILRRGCIFTSEDVRRWAEIEGFHTPVPKAWGSVFLKGAKRGLIVKVGISTAKQRHGSPCPQWAVG